MKRGDFVYDVVTEISDCEQSDNSSESESMINNNFPFPYIVDIEKDQPEHVKILRNGLTIRDPYKLWDPKGSVLPDMYTLTEFPIGYFDRLVYKKNMCQYFDSDVNKISPCSVWLDVVKLKLNTLKYENVFHIKTIEYPMNHVHYLYTILIYKKKSYMIINKEDQTKDQIEDQKDDGDYQHFMDRFICHFKDPCLIKVSDQINHKVQEIANNEDVLKENILMIKIE